MLHRKGPRSLATGCGGGILSNALVVMDPGYSVVGIDLSEGGIAYARSTAEKLGHSGRASFDLGSAYKLPFEDGSFDSVVISDVLEHLSDLPTALSEARRVLRPGGVFLYDTLDRTTVSFVLAIVGAEYITSITPRGSHDWRLFIQPEELQRGLAAAGFKDFAAESYRPTPPALVTMALRSWGLISKESLAGHFEVVPLSSGPVLSYIGFAVTSQGSVQSGGPADGTSVPVNTEL
eukprot:TRINITY_DN9601_c0_g1_i3.p1 TRINITY_DN9601_c0_g1~~TRINITY_DN9601_c0_g1_i3.p1  ORF type:complete len:235 (-),score=20.06 TRINITY_DN9601_c0_g1_i3:151-855(-)